MKILQEKVLIWSHLGRARASDPWVLETDLKYVRMSHNDCRRRDSHNEDREIGRVCLSLCAIDLARDFSCLSFPVANVNGWASRHNTLHTKTAYHKLLSLCLDKQVCRAPPIPRPIPVLYWALCWKTLIRCVCGSVSHMVTLYIYIYILYIFTLYESVGICLIWLASLAYDYVYLLSTILKGTIAKQACFVLWL